MKKQLFKVGITLLITLFLSGNSLLVSGQDAVKEIAKSYKIEKGFTLGIDNEYGEINIINQEGNELSVVVRIETKSVTQERAEALLDNVNIIIEEGSSKVYFETEIEKNNLNQRNRIRVVYTVKTPKYLNIDLEQSYGNIFIQDINGLANLEVRYGNITANSLGSTDKNERNSLELAYGNGSIESVTSLSAEVKYSEITFSKAQILSIESAYSKVNIGQANEVDIESKYDKVNVQELTGVFTVESAYTQVGVGKLMKGFDLVDAEMSYGNLNVGADAGLAFKIDAEVSYGSINIPAGSYDVNKEGTREEVYGMVGASSDSNITVSLKYGNFTLK